MSLAIGLVLALGVPGYATVMRLDRDRALYPVMLIVIASYYVLFAVMGGSARVIVIESVIAGGFVAGEGSGWWWPGFCLTCDLVAAAFLTWLLLRASRASATRGG